MSERKCLLSAQCAICINIELSLPYSSASLLDAAGIALRLAADFHLYCAAAVALDPCPKLLFQPFIRVTCEAAAAIDAHFPPLGT
jgi:hypothetical protein